MRRLWGNKQNRLWAPCLNTIITAKIIVLECWSMFCLLTTKFLNVGYVVMKWTEFIHLLQQFLKVRAGALSHDRRRNDEMQRMQKAHYI